MRFGNAQEHSDSASSYENTKDGLRHLLTDLRSAAKRGDAEVLASFVAKFEIPDCGAWLHQMYDSDKADSWMGQCDPEKLKVNEKSLRELLIRLSTQEGEFSVRKVNDDPEPGRGMEWGWLQAVHHPLGIYFASWKLSDAETEPIGYFMYINGAFRWESDIVILKRSQTKAPKKQFVPPKLVKKISPNYPADAASRRVTGAVRLTFLVGADGALYNVRANFGEGLSEDSSLIEAAKAAVLQWKFEPGTLDGQPIAIDNISATVTFVPNN